MGGLLVSQLVGPHLEMKVKFWSVKFRPLEFGSCLTLTARPLLLAPDWARKSISISAAAAYLFVGNRGAMFQTFQD